MINIDFKTVLQVIKVDTVRIDVIKALDLESLTIICKDETQRDELFAKYVSELS